jgi:hypothetical protein
MQFLESARAWLAAINPALPAVALVLVLWAPQAAIRRWLPALWAVPASWGPKAQMLRQAWQSLPSLAGGALLGALSSGGDPWQAAWGAVVAVATPFWHHLLKASPLPYQGELGGKDDDDKTPPTGTKPVGPVLMAFVALLLVGCSGSQPALSDANAARAVEAAFKACELFPHLPPELRSDADEKACEAMKRARTICTDVIAPAPAGEAPAPAPAGEAPAPDAGTGDDTREKPVDSGAGAP